MGIDGNAFDVVTAIAPHPHPRFSRFFAGMKKKLRLWYLRAGLQPTRPARSPRQRRRASTIRCSISRCPTSTRGYQVKAGAVPREVTVPINDHIDYDGGIVTWIDNINSDRPYGNDLSN